jgi:hypothetical protein
MIVVPAGKFIMGSPKDESDREGSERPQHEVTTAATQASHSSNVTSNFGADLQRQPLRPLLVLVLKNLKVMQDFSCFEIIMLLTCTS